jgi:hypothetical protein
MDAFLPYLLVFLLFVWKVEALPLLASGGGGVEPDGTTAKNIVFFPYFCSIYSSLGTFYI